MSRAHPEESKITTDRETIQGWVGEHDAIPVRYSGVEGESGTLRIVPATRREESHEEVSWDEFFEEMERSDQVVVYHGTDYPEPFEVRSRQDAIGKTTTADADVEEALVEGETVTSEVTETTVVERTIVEEATVESEVIDRELVSEEIVDAELLTRDVTGLELEEYEVEYDAERDAALFQPEGRSTLGEGVEIQVRVDEGWSVTKELVERLTIESRVVDTEATETDTVEADTVESSVNVEGVQRTVLESDLVDTQTDVDVIESGKVESEFHEGEVVRTRLFERKTVDEEVSVRRLLTGEVTSAETIDVDTVNREVIESEIVGEEAIEGGTAAMAGAEPEDADAARPAVGDESAVLSEDDEGKTVVDATGDEVGMVVGVEGDLLYVDPHPSITDRIKTALGWGGPDEDDYTIGPDRIAATTDDAVRLVSVEPEAEDEPR